MKKNKICAVCKKKTDILMSSSKNKCLECYLEYSDCIANESFSKYGALRRR